MLPVAATLLLMPPLIGIFATSATLGGIPLIVVYIFAVWAAIILAAVVVARHVDQASVDPEDRPDTTERR